MHCSKNLRLARPTPHLSAKRLASNPISPRHLKIKKWHLLPKHQPNFNFAFYFSKTWNKLVEYPLENVMPSETFLFFVALSLPSHVPGSLSSSRAFPIEQLNRVINRSSSTPEFVGYHPPWSCKPAAALPPLSIRGDGNGSAGST